MLRSSPRLRRATRHRGTARAVGRRDLVCGAGRMTMNNVTGWLVSLACAAALGACLAGPGPALEDAAPISDEPVVPPGQDQLLATMHGRGAALPDGCKFAGGVADGPTIR